VADSGEVVEVARAIADEVLFPAALAVDRAAEIPAGHLDRLAAAGLYGAAGPVGAGGLDLPLPELCAVVEALAGGCLATTFVWVQHHGAVRAVAAGPAALRAEWLGPLCRGERRAGIALTGAMPGPARLRARPAGDGWLLAGTAPWVTGWSGLDALLAVARGPDDTLVSLLLDVAGRPGLVARRQRLVAVDASATVELEFTDLPVDGSRLLAIEPYQPGHAGAALRLNGSLALGLIARCCRLIGPSALDAQLAACRQALDAALEADTADPMAAARAATAELALRAAATTVVHAGSRSLLLDQHPQRLAREATFLLVFATRPAIRTTLLTHLATTTSD
jgi:alkylation response protein AidB-like acyl-CoA dehydrogenase